jgi:hypothetical protein
MRVYFRYLHNFICIITINVSLKCKCCVLNEEIQGKFGENLWKIRQTTNEDFSLQEGIQRWHCYIIFFLAGKQHNEPFSWEISR